jgi:hypothetical protein
MSYSASTLRIQRHRQLTLLSKPLAPVYLQDLVPIKIQDEEAESRRKIALLTMGINAVNKSRQGHKSFSGNLL